MLTTLRLYSLVMMVCAFFFSLAVNGQDAHVPVYAPQSADFRITNQVFSLIQGDYGIMYFGTDEELGVVAYDGSGLTKHPAPKGGNVMSMTNGESGRIYVGMVNQFGYYETTRGDSMVYHSLSGRLPDSLQFSHIWSTHFSNHKVYFQSGSRHFFVYDVQSDSLVHLQAPPDDFETYDVSNNLHTSFIVDDTFITNLYNIGPCHLEGDSLVPWKESELFGNSSIYGIVKNDSCYTLITTEECPIVQYYPQGIPADTPDSLRRGAYYRKVHTVDEERLRKFRINSVTRLRNGNYAFTTYGSGLILLDENFKILDQIKTSSGLASDRCYQVVEDHQGKLWVGTFFGVSCVIYDSPIKTMKSISEVFNGLRDVVIFKGNTYLTGINGLLVLSDNKIEGAVYSKEQADGRFISLIDNEKVGKIQQFSDQLFFASDAGLFRLQHDEMKMEKFSDLAARSFYRSDSRPNTLFVVGKYGLYYLLDTGDGKLEIQDIVEGTADIDMEEVFENVNYAGEGIELWVSVPLQSKVMRLHFDDTPVLEKPEIKWFGSADGLPASANNIFKWGHKILVGTNDGFYRYDAKTETFVFDERVNSKDKMGNISSYRFQQSPSGALWKLSENQIQIAQNWMDENELKWYEFPHANYADYYGLGAMKYMYMDSQDVWILSTQGIAIVDPAKLPFKVHAMKTMLRQLYMEDSLVFSGYLYDGNELKAEGYKQPFVFDHGEYRLKFTYTADNFERPENIEFRTWIENYEDSWSDWSISRMREVSNLPEGDYVFHVEARGPFLERATPAQLAFTVNPPWYRTVWAYIAYGILGIIFIIIVVRIYSYRLKRANIRLSQLVDEKTSEIREQKEEIEEQRDDIQQKNKALTDSINYAKSLQQAILPDEEVIKQVLPENMIFFRPRDIVSGDFYWFHHNDNEIWFAAVDCTGHGVPGSMVSMIGSNQLQQIVVEQGEKNPATVLQKLNAGVQKVFKREGNVHTANDGMDIALCKYIPSEKRVEFAGAHRPLVIIRGEDMIELKGDRMPIGGRTKLDSTFTLSAFEVEKGDMLYMFSDGYPDQFGGKEGRKFMTGKFKKLLLSITPLPVDEQKELLDDALEKWQGDRSRVDDILVVGFRIV